MGLPEATYCYDSMADRTSIVYGQPWNEESSARARVADQGL
jgi:hypothetical protein